MNNEWYTDRLPCERSDIQPLDGQYKTGCQDSSLGTNFCVSIMCQPDGTAHDQISQASPAIFHTGSDEILAVGTAWKRGYMYATCQIMMHGHHSGPSDHFLEISAKIKKIKRRKFEEDSPGVIISAALLLYYLHCHCSFLLSPGPRTFLFLSPQ